MNLYKYLLIPVMFFILQLVFIFLFTGCGSFEAKQIFSSEISAPFKDDTITIRTFSTQAGAIGSLTLRGVEYIDPTDHGASLQSDDFYDNDPNYNPTEAGGDYDGPTDWNSTSVLMNLYAYKNVLVTQTNMALFEPYHGTLRLPGDEIFSKKVVIGYRGLPNVIEYNVNFKVPAAHSVGVFEALTGYMPVNFSQYYTFNMNTGLVQHWPFYGIGGIDESFAVICATGDNSSAMAAVALTPNAKMAIFGDQFYYGPDDQANKWNIAYYINNVIPQTYSFQMLVVVGTMDEVIDSLNKLRN